MKIGLPRALFYYYQGELIINYLKELGLEVIISKQTDKEIVQLGNKMAIDEMCLSLKIFLGHIAYLEDKCDYIIIPTIINYGIKDQMCANYRVLYDLTNNLFDYKILDFKIDYEHNETEKKGLLSIGKKLGFDLKTCKKAYKKSLNLYNGNIKQKIMKNVLKLKTERKKILLVGHSYNLHDDYISKDIINYLEKEEVDVIFSDLFDSIATNNMSKYLSRELYWKYSKESIGSIVLCQDKIDGIVFLTSFPCGLDSLVNELVMRKINTPYLNLVIDDLSGFNGIETRLESFIDIIKQ